MPTMHKLLVGFLLLFGLGCGVFLAWWKPWETNKPLLSPISTSQTPDPTPKPLLAYTFDNLSKRSYSGSEIRFEKVINEKENKDNRFISYLFSFFSDGKKVTGQANVPVSEPGKKMPVIIMLHGYVDRESYETGIGTKRAAGVFADHGYVTLAPDFLGYGHSDMPENDVWWERFNNPVQVLNLLASIRTMPQANTERIGIWAHSNGGQIALSVLEITGKAYPTILWAPVTKPFPYSILYFTDEFEDHGRALRAELARLEKDYDVNQYSITTYFDRIKAPIQLHQGGADDAVPLEWSDSFAKTLKSLDIDVTYFTYSEADHNMSGSWEKVVERDLAFLKKELN